VSGAYPALRAHLRHTALDPRGIGRCKPDRSLFRVVELSCSWIRELLLLGPSVMYDVAWDRGRGRVSGAYPVLRAHLRHTALDLRGIGRCNPDVKVRNFTLFPSLQR
jgi:hypothetical protein